MTGKRMAEATINASLDAHLHSAKAGDLEQARHLHKLFDHMLMEKELPDGKLWLTEHGKTLLAEMHRELGHCEGGGEQLRSRALEAVRLHPHGSPGEENYAYVQDLRVAIAVANELCEQRSAGEKPDVARAAQAVARSGQFSLDEPRICAIFDEVSTSVGGFKKFQVADAGERHQPRAS
jgi:hypothetical protein